MRLLRRCYSIKQRCYNPNHKSYINYGARGIKVYKNWLGKWKEMVAYLETLEGHGDPNLTIDRIDNNGDYEPGNLRFVSMAFQHSNKRKRSDSILIEYKGKQYSVNKFILDLGLKYSAKTVYGYLCEGMSPDDIILKSNKRNATYKRSANIIITYLGEEYSVKEFKKTFNLKCSKRYIRTLVKKGLLGEQILEILENR